MQTVDASVILEDAERLLGWDLDQLETRQKQIARTALSMALQEVWESWWWSHLMKSEAVPGAPVYDSATAYAADEFVYYPATQKYYHAMKATTGNQPATFTNGSYITNYTYWAEAKSNPSAGDYVAGTSYNLGDQVRNPTDGEIYQNCDFGMLVDFDTSVILRPVAPQNGKLAYFYPSGGGDWTLYWDGTKWILHNHFGDIYTSTEDVATPDLVETWVGSGYFTGVPMSLTSTATSSPDTALVWHKLIPFVPTCEIHCPVRAVGDLDPRNRACLLYNFDETAEGVRIPDLTTGVPWIWYRRATPVLTGDDYSATAAYTAAETLTYD